MQLRAVLATTAASTSFVGEDGNQTPYPTPDPSLVSTPTASPTNGSDLSWVTPALQAKFLAYDCSNKRTTRRTRPGSAADRVRPDRHREVHPRSGRTRRLVDHDATAGMNTQNGQWVVNVVFDDQGTKTFGEVSQRLYAFTQAGKSPQNQFAFVLDGAVISAPSMNGVILDGKPQISGSFTRRARRRSPTS
jgi:preprotein translocase subunit SecD